MKIKAIPLALLTLCLCWPLARATTLLTEDFESFATGSISGSQTIDGVTYNNVAFLDDGSATPFGSSNTFMHVSTGSRTVRINNLLSPLTTYSFDVFEPSAGADGYILFGIGATDLNGSNGHTTWGLDDGEVLVASYTQLDSGTVPTLSEDTHYKVYVLYNGSGSTQTVQANGPTDILPGQSALFFEEVSTGTLLDAGRYSSLNSTSPSTHNDFLFRSFSNGYNDIYVDNLTVDDTLVVPGGGGGGGGSYPSVDHFFNEFQVWGLDEVTEKDELSLTLNTTENGGTTTTFTLADPVRAVDVSDPANPDFSTEIPYHFGGSIAADNVGVGYPLNSGRFHRGESFTLTATRDFRLNRMGWETNSQTDGDLHFKWTQDGVEQSLVLELTYAMDLIPYNIVLDANTPLVITNVSPDLGSEFTHRTAVRYFLGNLMFASEPTYDMSGSGGLPQMFGVNIAGGEFDNYSFLEALNDPEQWEYYEEKGMELIRFAFRWKRLQPTLGGPLDSTQLANLQAALDLCEQHDMKLILNCHDYYSWGQDDDYGFSVSIGETDHGYTVTNAHFRDLWERLAMEFGDHPALYAYGLMNEPQTSDANWAATAQEALNGIRTIDTDTWIILAGHSYSKGHNWPDGHTNLIQVTDPSDKIMYEAHAYFDANSDGWNYQSYDAENVSPMTFHIRVASFINWLHATGNRGFIGEFNVPDDGDPRWMEGLQRFMDQLMASGLSGTYWAGGSHWTENNWKIHPTDNYQTDRTQMGILEQYGTNANLPTDIYVDNADPVGVTTQGSWVSSTSASGYYGTDYVHDDYTDGISKWIRFTPDLPISEIYTVYTRWTAYSNRDDNVPIDIQHTSGTTGVLVNQKVNGSQWVSLGSYAFDKGTAGNVTISNDGTTQAVIADAVRFELRPDLPREVIVDNADPTGATHQGEWQSSVSSSGYYGDDYQHDQNDGKGSKWFRFTPDLSVTGDYTVYMRWTAYSNRDDNVPVDIAHLDGTATTTVNQTQNNNQWVELGTFSFQEGTSGHVTIRNDGTTQVVIADAVKFVLEE